MGGHLGRGGGAFREGWGGHLGRGGGVHLGRGGGHLGRGGGGEAFREGWRGAFLPPLGELLPPPRLL